MRTPSAGSIALIIFKGRAILVGIFGNSLRRGCHDIRSTRFEITFSPAPALLQANHALASHSPALAAAGNASAITQSVMTYVVHGASVAVIVTGLMGALRYR
jgi:hypothetical protein